MYWPMLNKIEMSELLWETGGSRGLLREVDMLEWDYYRRLANLPADHIPHKSPEGTIY